MILNGANMNLLGVREPHIDGTTTLAAVEASCQEFAGVIGATVAFHQSNHEGAVVDWIHAARSKADARCHGSRQTKPYPSGLARRTISSCRSTTR